MAQPQAGLVAGIDGGQTSTRCILARSDGAVLGRGSGGPLSHFAAQDGPQRYRRAVGEAAALAWQDAGLLPQPLAAVGLGLTGVEAGSAEATTARALLAGILSARQIDVQSDAVTALLGAHAGRPGIMVIAGTGTIALGMDEQGRCVRAGGWGWLLGDGGSAMAIGRDGLIAALEAADGMAPPTALVQVFVARFQLQDLRDIKHHVFAPDFGARGFASLAPLVTAAAAGGDPVAQAVVDGAGQALAREVAAVARRLASPASLPVATIGGAFQDAGLRAAFARALAAAAPGLPIVEPALPPALGAVILALRLCGANVEQALPKLRLANT